MESHANSVEDRLIDGLSFKLAPGASYVQERKSVTFHPSGSNSYSSAGTKLIKLHITGDGWLDTSTFRIMFDLNNDDPTATKLLRPLGGPWCFFRRMRVLAANQVIEDIFAEITCPRAYLYDAKVRRTSQKVPHLRELSCQRSSENRVEV